MTSTEAEDLLDDVIKEVGVDAYLQFDDSSNIDHRYVTGFEASDAFGYLRYEHESILLVAPLEKGRAQDESDADTVRSTSEFVNDDVRDDVEAEAEVLQQFVREYGIRQLGVPRDFDLYLAERLESEGIEVDSVRDVIMEARIQKSESELEALAEAQAATEQAMAHAETILRESEVVDGILHYEGEVLTSEQLRAELRRFLMDKQCSLDEAIAACGRSAADPHDLGSGPLKADEPILFDIYPQHESGYWGDMSRTFVKGSPSPGFEEMYQATLDAFEAALDVLEGGAGVTGAEVHNTVCDVFEEAGYQTIRDGDIDEGFLHSTGHAIGLELHEPPRLVGEAGELAAGTVLTVEPGLYIPEHGGVRIEDMVVVEEDGYRNLNDLHHDWEL